MNKKRLLAFFLLASTVMPVAHAALDSGDDQELLPAEKAFALSTKVIDGNTIEASWAIAKGYYLYRDKFKFTVTGGKATIGTVSFPKGEMKKDPTFGDTEIYHDRVAVRVPLTRANAKAETISIRFDYQGCNDPIGVCYPPATTTVAFKLPAAAISPSALQSPIESPAKPIGSLKSLNNLLQGDSSQQEFLPVTQAFPISAQRKDGNTIDVLLGVTETYYLYRDKIRFELLAADGTPASGIALGKVTLPKGKMKKDPTFGDTEIYKKPVGVLLPLTVSNPALAQARLRIHYQGCAEGGICYPPSKHDYRLALSGGQLAAMNEIVDGQTSTFAPATAQAESPAAPAPSSDEDLTEEEQIVKLFSEGNIVTILFSMLGLGLALAFTACMYPMIPIVSSIVMGQGEKVTPAKGLLLSLVYVEAMAATFGVIGGIIGGLGKSIGVQAYFQNPWVLTAFAILFVALALSMFGLYNIQVPASIQGKLSQWSSKQKGGTLIGVAVIGVLSALIVGPCGGPVLLGALAGAAGTGNPALGFLYLFTLANGMGLPLLLVGAGGGTLLPKAGPWMSAVKGAAGVILLAVAIYFLERVLPSTVYMLLWALLFIVTGVFLGALDSLPEGTSGWRRLWKGLGIALILYGIIVALGGLTGARNFNDPLHGSKLLSSNRDVTPMVTAGGMRPAYVVQAAGKQAVVKGGLTFIRIKTRADFQRELASANLKGHTLMMDFYADWCVYCKQFDDYVFSERSVQVALGNTVLLQADVTAMDNQDKELMKHLGVTLPPAILFFKIDGKESRRQRIIGFMKADRFKARLEGAFG